MCSESINRPFNFLFVIVFFVIACYYETSAQSDERSNYNPLPPGPTRITGAIVDQHGNPVKGATITVLYPDRKQRKEDTFLSNEWGRYEASVFRYDQPYVTICIKVKNKVCAIRRYDNPGMGMNLGFNEKPVVCKVKQGGARDD